MKTDVPYADVTMGLVLLVTILVCATASRNAIWGDAYPCWNASLAMVNEGVPSVGSFQRDDVFTGPDGRRYCKYSALQSLHCVPLVFLMKAFQVPYDGGMSFHLLAAIIPGLSGGLVVAGMFLVAVELGTPPRRAACLSLLIFFGSPLWVYSRYLYGEIQQAAILIWLYYSWIRCRRTLGWKALVGHGFLLGLALNAKSTLLLFSPLLYVDLIIRKRSFGELTRAAAWTSAGLLPGVLLFVWYNDIRYGEFFTLGYSGEPFDTPFVTGAYGLLLSSGKSVFLYFPLMVVSIVGYRSFLRRFPAIAIGIALPSLASFGVVACWWAWSGDFGWGPRLLVPLFPLMGVIAIVESTTGRASRYMYYFLGITGILVNCLGVLIHNGSFLDAAGKNSLQPEYIWFVPEYSPVAGHFEWTMDALRTGSGSEAAGQSAASVIRQPRPKLDVWWDPLAKNALALILLLAGGACTMFWVRSCLRGVAERDGALETD